MTHFCPCIVNRLVNRSTIYCGDFLAMIKNSSIQNSATPKPCVLDDFGRRRTQIYRNKSRTNAAESAIRQDFGAGSDYYCYPSRTGVEPSWFWHADLSDSCSFPLGHIAYMPCEKSFWTRKNLLCQNCSHPPANAFLIDFGVILRSYIEILRAKARQKMRKCIVVGQFGSAPVRLG